MEKKVPMLVENREPLYDEWEFRETIEHIADHSKYEGTNIDTTIIFSFVVHFGPQEHSWCNEGDDNYLNGLENVNKRVPLDQKPFFIKVCLKKL